MLYGGGAKVISLQTDTWTINTAVDTEFILVYFGKPCSGGDQNPELLNFTMSEDSIGAIMDMSRK